MTTHRSVSSLGTSDDAIPNRDGRLAAARSILAELSSVSRPEREHSVNNEASNLVSLGIDDLDAHLAGGLKRTGVHEVFASAIGDETAATGFVAGLSACAMRDRPGPVLWIDTLFSAQEDGLLWPPGLADWGIAPDRLIRATARHPRDALRMADDALAMSALGVVVLELRGPAPMLDLTALRRLHLGAEARAVPCFLLRFGADPIASPALTRWSIAARPGFERRSGQGYLEKPNRYLLGHPRFGADLARHRGGSLGSWLLEWCSDVQSFVAPAAVAISEPAIPPVQHRPYRQTFAA